MERFNRLTLWEWISLKNRIPGQFLLPKSISVSALSDDLLQRLSSVGTGVVIANDLNQTVSGKALDAVQGKVLKDGLNALTNSVNGEFSNVNSANKLVRLDGTGKLPSLDGSQLTGLPSSATPVANNLVTTTSGSALDARQGKILNDLITTLKDGSTVTIAQLVTQLATLNTIVTSTTADGDSFVDTIQELLTVFSTYPEGLDVATALGSKINTSDIANLLTQTASGKVLDARQGKVLKDLIDGLTVQLTTFNEANQLVKLDGTGKLPAIDGSQLTNLPSAQSGGSAYTVTTLTRNAIQTAIDGVASNARITLSPGIYDFTTGGSLNFGGKTNVVLDGFGSAYFNLTSGIAILFNGNNVNSRITGINFRNLSASGNGAGFIVINEQGSNDGLEIDHCSFSAPSFRCNGITASVYSVQANGGNGTGKLTQDVRIHDNRFVSLGRMGVELVNHTWDDSKTTIYLKNIQIYHNYFNDLGKVAENDGTTFNGMAISNSGYANDIKITSNEIIDAKLLGIELAGSEKAIIANNTIDSVNNSFTGISVSDNSHNATKYITVIGNNVRTKAKCLAMNQVQDFIVSSNTFVQSAVSTSGGTLYFQNCNRGNLTGGLVIGNSDNTIRIDDTNKMYIGGGLRAQSINTGNFSLVSIFGSASPAGSSYITVGTDCMFEKLGGPAGSGVVEVIGNTSNITGVR